MKGEIDPDFRFIHIEAESEPEKVLIMAVNQLLRAGKNKKAAKVLVELIGMS